MAACLARYLVASVARRVVMVMSRGDGRFAIHGDKAMPEHSACRQIVPKVAVTHHF
jgi:hypothetical protein